MNLDQPVPLGFLPPLVPHLVRYGDGAGNTDEENSSIFSLIRMH